MPVNPNGGSSGPQANGNGSNHVPHIFSHGSLISLIASVPAIAIAMVFGHELIILDDSLRPIDRLLCWFEPLPSKPNEAVSAVLVFSNRQYRQDVVDSLGPQLNADGKSRVVTSTCRPPTNAEIHDQISKTGFNAAYVAENRHSGRMLMQTNEPGRLRSFNVKDVDELATSSDLDLAENLSLRAVESLKSFLFNFSDSGAFDEAAEQLSNNPLLKPHPAQCQARMVVAETLLIKSTRETARQQFEYVALNCGDVQELELRAHAHLGDIDSDECHLGSDAISQNWHASNCQTAAAHYRKLIKNEEFRRNSLGLWFEVGRRYCLIRLQKLEEVPDDELSQIGQLLPRLQLAGLETNADKTKQDQILELSLRVNDENKTRDKVKAETPSKPEKSSKVLASMKDASPREQSHRSIRCRLLTPNECTSSHHQLWRKF